MSHKDTHIKLGRNTAALIITNRQDQVLWCKRGETAPFLGSYWAFVGGMVSSLDLQVSTEPRSILKTTALREANEELGLELKIDELNLDHLEWVGSWSTPPYLPKQIICDFFTIEAGSLGLEHNSLPPFAKRQKDQELEEVAWASPQEFYQRWQQGQVTLAPPTLAFCRAMAQQQTLAQAATLYPELLRLNQVTPSIQLLPLRSATLPPATHTNCYLVGTQEFYIVDPGSKIKSELDKLYHEIEHRLAQGDTLLGTILTHHHHDHCAGLNDLRSRYPQQLFAHPLTAQLLKIDDYTPLLEGQTLAWKDSVQGQDYIEVWHTPGHAPGHICLVHHRSQTAIVGDMVAGVGSIVIEPDDGDMEAYLDSLERLKRRGFQRLLPSHGPPIANTNYLLTHYIQHRLEREAKIYQALPQAFELNQGAGELSWLSLAEVVAKAYSDAPAVVKKGRYGGLAGQAALSHLIYLEKQGKVLCSETKATTKSRWLAYHPYLDRFAHSLVRLKAMMNTLRVQCPWDRKQSLDSLKRYLIEESYEVLDSMSDEQEHREELGDLFFQILFQSVIREQDQHFDLADVFDALANKLSRRHPHVFGDLHVTDATEVKDLWQSIKAQERQKKAEQKVEQKNKQETISEHVHQQQTSLLSGIPKSAPALLKAQLIGEKAATVGFEWPSVEGALAKVDEERLEVIEAIQSGTQEQVLSELGDLFFAVVNVCRHMDIDPQRALESTNQTFSKRFQYVEYLAQQKQLDLKQLHIDDLEELWQQAKAYLTS